MRTRLTTLLIALFGLLVPTKFADAAPSSFIEPILGQLVGFNLPAGFEMGQVQSNADQYFRGAFLKGETEKTWTQMITITGAKDADPKKSAQFVAAHISSSIQRQCPDTFSVKPMGPTKIDGQDAFVAIASCGKVGADKHSETALMITIRGAKAIYTVQWAERTPSNAENLTIDESKWKGRLEKLIPFRVCPVVAGEKAPYPSCGRK
jgi:hypothetical protein